MAKLVRSVTAETRQLDPEKERQTISYSVLKADKSGKSVADEYYTHQAELIKKDDHYELQLQLKAKHDLVIFKPVSMGLGKIISSTTTTENGEDIWTYTTEFKSLSALNYLVKGKIEYSVPSYGLNNETYDIWFDFKTGTESSSTNKLDSVHQDKSQTHEVSQGQAQAAVPASKQAVTTPRFNSTQRDEAISSPKTTASKAKAPKYDLAAKKRELAKYRVPKKKTYAEVALVHYPIGEAVGIFFVIDLAVIAGAIFWRKQRQKVGKQ